MDLSRTTVMVCELDLFQDSYCEKGNENSDAMTAEEFLKQLRISHDGPKITRSQTKQ
jgi:hypothetical protein